MADTMSVNPDDTQEICAKYNVMDAADWTLVSRETMASEGLLHMRPPSKSPQGALEISSVAEQETQDT